MSSEFDTILQHAAAHMKAGLLTEAEQLCRDILAAGSEHPETLHILGVLMHRMNRQDDAADYLRRAVHAAPEAAPYRTNLGVVLQTLGEREEAIRQFEHAIKLDPDAMHARSNLGAMFAETGRLGRAKEVFESALEKKPNFAHAHNNLGNLYEREENPEAAIECYRRATECDPNLTPAFARLGHVLHALGQVSEAEAACARALELDPKNACALRTSARIFMGKGEFQNAETAVRKAIEADPEAALGHLILGHALSTDGKTAEAIESFSKAIKSPAPSAECFMALGNLLASQGLLEKNWDLLPTISVATAAAAGIVLPKILDVLTSYVLLEQENWFEEEIGFVGKMLRPGDQAVDVGANYGCYTLVMSASTGGAGRVWAFEPAGLTAQFLRKSLQVCDATNVQISESAVSDLVGFASFHNSKDPELSSLRATDETVYTAQVPTTTLDHCSVELGWNDIALLKIDAEGREQEILIGGREFFARQSPLVMYEIVENQKIHKELITLFLDIDYQSYRLVPGLNTLVPFDEPGLEHVKLLNIFACKADRAAELAGRGLLVDAPNLPPLPDDNWINYLRGTAYSDAQSESIDALAAANAAEQVSYREAIGWYAESQKQDARPEARYACLLRCAALLELMVDPNDSRSWPQLTLFARVAIDLGWGLKATQLLEPVVARLVSGEQLPLADPFVPGHARFDQVSPRDRLDDWIVAGIVEAYLRNVSFSSKFANQFQVAAYSFLKGNPFSSPEMTRRRLLLRGRRNLSPDTTANDPIYQQGPDNLNSEFWRENFPAP